MEAPEKNVFTGEVHPVRNSICHDSKPKSCYFLRGNYHFILRSPAHLAGQSDTMGWI